MHRVRVLPILISEIISKLIAEMDANTDKTTRCGTVSAERFSKSGSESVKNRRYEY